MNRLSAQAFGLAFEFKRAWQKPGLKMIEGASNGCALILNLCERVFLSAKQAGAAQSINQQRNVPLFFKVVPQLNACGKNRFARFF